MAYVKAVALRWASDDFPGWIEIGITDASGTECRFVEKQPVVDARDELTEATSYPVVIEVACEVVSSEVDPAGSSIVTIALDHGIVHEEAGAEFRVHADQVVSRRS